LVVDLKADQVLPRPVLYKELKLNRALRKMKLLAEPRLPLSPVSEEIYNEILRMAGLPVVPMLR
jgi:predicted RNA-binding protein with PUA-like domain